MVIVDRGDGGVAARGALVVRDDQRGCDLDHRLRLRWYVSRTCSLSLHPSIERPLVDGWLLMHDAYGSLDLYYTAQIDAGQLFYEDDDDSFSVPTDDDEDRPVTSPNNGACSTSTSTSTICNPTET